MKRASSGNIDDGENDNENEDTDIENIISQKVSQMEQDQHTDSLNRRHGFTDNRIGNKMSKRQQRSLKELNAVQSLEVWEEILDKNALTAVDFESSRLSNFDITLRKSNLSPAQNLSARKKSRKSSMYSPNMADITNESWMKSRSTDCLAEERVTMEKRNSQMIKITSYSEWDLAESYHNDIKDHNNVIDMYITGNIVNMVTGSNFYEYDENSIIKCVQKNELIPKNRTSLDKRSTISKNDLEEFEICKPKIVDVVFKESYIKSQLKQAEGEGVVPQTKFWLSELEKTLNTKFHKEE